MSPARAKAVVLATGLAFWPTPVWGQARSRVTFSMPGVRGLRTIGGRFGTDAAGLGGLARTAPQGTGDLLRSRLSGTGSFDISRLPAGGSGGAQSAFEFSRSAGQTYQGPSLHLRRSMGSAGGGPSLEGTAPLTGALEGYLEAMGQRSDSAIRKGGRIKSFVSTEPSIYQRQMRTADHSFRMRLYFEADGEYEVALTIARHSPEAHLSLVLSKFARGMWHTATHYLRDAVKGLPELPLVDMRLADFYGEAKDFAKHRQALEQSLKGPDANADLWFLAAYVRYFDGRQQKAAEALRESYRLARRTENAATTEAVATFWDGMVAAGKASGSVDPAAKPPPPATTTQPAAKSPPPPT